MSALLISTHLYEKRPLKKPKLGPPDVYPQDPKQKEDELTAINVKQGYSNSTAVQDEYGSARNANITSNRFGEYFSAILSKKHELNTLNDTSRKKQQINKDSTLFVTSKTKNYVDSWFKDLSSNAKTLAHLSRKVPIFNKKEEIFNTLYEFLVPMAKAEWFIKMSCAHHMAMSESNNKSKKRQTSDPSQEWTNFICKFMKDHYLRISESFNSSTNNSLSTIVTMHQLPTNSEELLKQWNYYAQLARHLYENGLLDKQDLLSWLLELFERIKSVDDPMLNLIVPMLVQYVDDFTQSEPLSRRLCYYSAKKINQLVVEFNVELHSLDSDKENHSSTSSQNNSTTEKSSSANSTPTKSSLTEPISSALIINGLVNANALSTCFKEVISCSKHRNILFSLSSIVQVIVLDCPTSLVWLNHMPSSPESSSGKHSSSILHGSPLDSLPCEPSNLPMPPSEHNERLRSHLRSSEELVRYRSKISEKKWFFKVFDNIKSSKSVGNVVNRLLGVLDYLDKHQFDRISSSNSFDSLYNKVFRHSTEHSTSHSSNTQIREQSSDLSNSYINSELAQDDVAMVRLLCEWAVTTKRLGEHRARVVAKLLERRQCEICIEKESSQSEQNQVNSNANSSGNAHNEATKMEVDENSATDKVQTEPSSVPCSNGARNAPNQASSDNNIPIYQNILFEFLDSYAPVYDDKSFNLYSSNSFSTPNVNSSSDSKQAFNNLILLFSELIRHEVFSHDAYMCTLISRGHFSSPPNTALVISSNTSQSNKTNNDDLLTGLVPSLSNIDSVSNGGLIGSTIHKSTSSSSLPMFDPLSNNSTLNNNEQSGGNWLSMNNDNIDEDLDDDLDKILQHIKAGQNSLNDQTDLLLPDAMESDKEDDAHGPNTSSTIAVANPTSLSDFSGVAKSASTDEQSNSSSRHLLYSLHFPLPQDEFFVHECNQRHILLYGVGKGKDEARHSVKKVTKEILKLFNRKSSMDINDSGKVKKHVIKEGFNFESAISKFQSLSIFDQQVVTNSCASAVLEMLNGVVSGTANHLPLIESVAFLFDLMEIALNVYGLAEFILQMLKELGEVESQLQQKCSMLARPYCTSIGLYIVGVLYRYNCYMTVSSDDILSIFEGLWKLVRNVTPNDCSSAERCIFFYIYDVYSNCSQILKKYHDPISPIVAKIKAMSPFTGESASVIAPSATCIMMDYLKNPKLKVDSSHLRQLNENISDRQSLVLNAICCIAEVNDMDLLNETSVLCAELTASCSQLAIEWLTAFKVLFTSTKNMAEPYNSLLSTLNFNDRAIFDNLAVFILILIARRCFNLDEFLPQVVLPAMLTYATTDPNDDAERCARLACHLILYLFKYYDSPLAASNSAINSCFASSSRYSLTSPSPLGLPTVPPPTTNGPKPPFVIKYACDRYLLGGVLFTLRIELVITLLKATFFLGTQNEKKPIDNKSFKPEKPDLNFNEILKPITNDDDFGEIGILSQISSKTKIDSLDKPPMGEFAKHALRQICLQDWVHDRCLRGFIVTPEILNKLMFDKRFSHRDAQQLLNMICYHKQMMPSSHVTEKCDSKQIISRVFNNLDEWSIRISWLQLYLIYEQLSSSSLSNTSAEVTGWLDTLARAVVEYFQNSSQVDPILDSKQLTLFTSKSSTMKTALTNGLSFGSNSGPQHSNERIWLIASLISKLPSALQGKILRVTAGVFDSSNWITSAQSQSSSMNSKSKSSFQGSKNSNSYNGIITNSQNATSTLLSYQPFISLISMCLTVKDDIRDSISAILNSMQQQISQCVNEKLSEDTRVKYSVQDGLQLRFSLVGAMFEVIQSSSSLTNDWSVLLMQLIIYTIVDPHINYANFTTVLDMLCALMHSAQMTVQPEQREENKKQYQNLIKKLKKELTTERMGLGVRMAKQLLPIVKVQTEVIACEPMGSLVDTKGNKIAGFDSIDKKQGLQVSEKQKLSPWDLLEGHKNPAPLGWTWFGAIRIERKPMRMEENFSLLARHNHNMHKSISYYIEDPPLPPEDEPAPPPPLIINQPPMQPLPFSNSNINICPTNGPNIAVPNSPHLVNIPAQGNAFNSSNLMHSLQAPQQAPHQISNNFNSPHMHHLAGLQANGLPHALSQGPPGPIHSGNLPNSLSQPNGPQSHMMPIAGTEHAMNQPGHHMMMNSHMNNSMMHMNNMPMDNRDMLMDSIAPANSAPMHPNAMQSGALAGLRPPLNAVPQPASMNPVNVNVGARAQTPKATKPKAPRRRRQNAKNPPVNGTPPVSGQQTPPIRMGNSFDNFNQPPVNSQMGQAMVGQSNNTWPYQQQIGNQQAPSQANMSGQQTPNVANQTFYQQAGPPGPSQTGPAMIPPQTQQARFNEPQNQNSKVRLRAMLSTRHPTSNTFNMAPNGTPGSVPTNPVNSNQMMGNNSNMMQSGIYQSRQPMQMMPQRAPMRPQGPVSQAGQPQMTQMSTPNSMFQQQQLSQSTNNGPMLHHIQQQQSQPNFNPAQNMNFNNNSMQSMDSTGMQQMGATGPAGFQSQQPQQSGMMMRPQMQQIPQQSNQNQFMQQRSQYNVPMGQQGPMSQPMNHSFGQPQQQQQLQMGSQPQHWPQASQMNAPRAPMTQLQRQLSANQAPQGQPQQGPHQAYHQVPY